MVDSYMKNIANVKGKYKEIWRERIISTAWTNPKQTPNKDDVIIQPGGTKQFTSRTTVIKSNPRPQENSNLQEHYNIPVCNPFSHLLN